MLAEVVSQNDEILVGSKFSKVVRTRCPKCPGSGFGRKFHNVRHPIIYILVISTTQLFVGNTVMTDIVIHRACGVKVQPLLDLFLLLMTVMFVAGGEWWLNVSVHIAMQLYFISPLTIYSQNST